MLLELDKTRVVVANLVSAAMITGADEPDPAQRGSSGSGAMLQLPGWQICKVPKKAVSVSSHTAQLKVQGGQPEIRLLYIVGSG